MFSFILYSRDSSTYILPNHFVASFCLLPSTFVIIHLKCGSSSVSSAYTESCLYSWVKWTMRNGSSSGPSRSNPHHPAKQLWSMSQYDPYLMPTLLDVRGTTQGSALSIRAFSEGSCNSLFLATTYFISVHLKTRLDLFSWLLVIQTFPWGHRVGWGKDGRCSRNR